MSSAMDEAAGSSSRHAGSASVSSRTDAGDQTASSMQLRNGVASPQSPGSDADSTINTSFAPSILASRLGRNIYSSSGAAGSTLSLAGPGFNSPSIALTGFNAVSTVLNNPSKRQHPIDPKSSRFPAVTPNHVPAEIPKVKKADLDPYLSSVRPEWDRFMRNQSMGRQGKATIEQQQQQQRASAQDPSGSYDSEPLGKSNRRHRPTYSIASLSADLQAVPPPQARKRLPNLSAVPQVFFSEDFDLGNPYTFDQVTERHKVDSTSPSEQRGVPPTYDVALNQMLQEKLSYYSDVIEQHLIIEIGQQSSSFFAALENLNDLNAEAESCLAKIGDLKAELQQIDEKQAKEGLSVIREQQHRRHLERKQTAVQNVREIIERHDLVRLLLQQGETEDALEMLNKLKSALRTPHGYEDEASPDRIADKASANSASDGASEVALAELKCLSTIPAQLEEMERALSDMLEQDLVAILKQDIDARLNAYRQHGLAPTIENGEYFSKDTSTKQDQNPATLAPPNTNLSGNEGVLSPSKPPPSPFGHSARKLSPADSDLASRIAPLVVGLAKTGGLEKAVAAYREVAIKAVQETWKASLSERSAEMAETVKWLLSEDPSKFDDHENLLPQAARIRDLEYSAFLEIGRELFEILIECLKTIDAQSKLVPRILDQLHASAESNRDGTASSTDIASHMNGPSSGLPTPPIMPQDVPTNLPSRLSDVVVASAEQAHTLCARLLTFRATTHAALELPPFLVVFQLCWSFVLSSEQLCRKMIVGLRGTVLSQAKGFLANFHRRRIERAAKAVEEETWAQAEVGAEIQAQIKQIVSSAVEDPAEFVVTGSEPAKAESKPDAESLSEQEGSATTKTLDIEDRQYFVVDASLDVLSLLVDYLKVIINLPLLTTEAMARVVEFLKQFNSRTCQVVLGAGAMRSAGLKNITAKHLALASQSLSIMISLIPYIRETVRRHLSPKQAVMLTEFDKLRRDFQEHQYEIHAKLVAIMSDRLTVHCRTLSNIDWNADKPTAEDTDGETKDPEPNKYAADLVKETATLHKVLSKYLQAVVVEHVIGQVLRSIDARIAQEFEKVQVQHQNALDRMQTDVRYFGTKLSALKHVEWKDDALQKVLESKRIVPPPVSNAAASAGTSTPNTDTAPGSPAIDKPVASPFGPVTYKPRIPNIFARRQQQQSQQGSPRGSTDVTGASTPMESRQSVEASPRMSLQQPSTATTQTNVQQNEASAPEPPAKSNAAGAQSIEDEVNEVPPTPPAKSQEVAPPAVVKDQDADGRESEDIVAPVVPAPEAVAKVLSEGVVQSSDIDMEKASTAAASVDPHSHKTVEVEKEKDLVAASEAKAEETAKMETSKEENSQATLPRVEAAPVPTSTAPPQPSTPTSKDASTANIQDATAASSPARSGVSTPVKTATASSTTLTASKPGRMSLKERLAEAARKRAQASAPVARPPSQPEAEATAAPASAVVEEVKKEEAAEQAVSQETVKEAGSAVPEKDVAQQEKTAGDTKAELVKPSSTSLSASSEKTPAQDKDEAKAKTTDQATTAATAPPSEAASAIPTAEATGARAQQASENEASSAQADDKPVAEAEGPTEDATLARDAGETKQVDVAPAIGKPSISGAKSEESQTTARVDSTPATPVIAEGDGDAEVDADGDGDDAEVDGDANEGTNDSAVSNTAGSGSKKNKKKKGKKK